MSRLVLAVATAAALASNASAQVPIGGARGGFGGGFRSNLATTPSYAAPIRPGLSSPFLYRPGTGIGGYYNPYLGGYGTFYGGGYYNPYFDGGYLVGSGLYGPYAGVVGPAPVDVAPPQPDPAAAQPPIVLANEFPATLVMEFPTAAKVWLNGEPVAGEDAATRELTSPVLKQGERHTFKVKARWAVDGKEYETTREVILGAGDRSKLLVLSGTPVAEKPDK
jgi:uncharacterized protein (TIGR03000 family)